MSLGTFMNSLRADRQAWPLLAMICITMIGSGMMAPVLSLYAATFGVTATMVGMLVTIFGVGRLMSNFPAGYVSQRVGRRPILIAGALIIGAGCAGAGLANDFESLVAWRFVQGVGSGMYMTVSAAALADLSNSETRTRLVSMYQAALQLGATLGPVFGGFIASRFGLAAPFWALLVISAATAAVGMIAFRDRHAPVSTRSAAMGAQRGLWTLPFISISLVSCVVFFTRTAYLFQIAPLMGDQDFRLGVGAIGLAVTLSAGAILLVLPLSSLLIRRLGSRMSVALSLILSAVGIVMILGGSHQAWFWASMIVYGLASGFNGPAVGAYTIEVLPRAKYGSGMGLQRTISDVGYVAGPVAVGLVADWSASGNAAAAWACGALLALAVVLFAAASAPGKRRLS